MAPHPTLHLAQGVVPFADKAGEGLPARRIPAKRSFQIHQRQSRVVLPCTIVLCTRR